MSFSTIPVRSNAERITASWFNLLRTAGLAIEGFLGAGYIGETEFSIGNDVQSPTEITGLSFSSASYSSAVIKAEIRRTTSTTELVAVVTATLRYLTLSNSWVIEQSEVGDDVDVTLQVTSSGQVRYISGGVAGAGYTGTMKYKAETFDA